MNIKTFFKRSKVGYVDGFVIPLPKKNLAMYKRMAQDGARLWLKHGALDYKECIGDDITPPWGLAFPKMAKLKRGEVVVFSFIGFKSRAHRDQVNALVFKDPEMHPEKQKDKPMPFNIKRMAYGGFKVLVG
jgi:uncharacterized protein YbaA (DUF1428 family)